MCFDCGSDMCDGGCGGPGWKNVPADRPWSSLTPDEQQRFRARIGNETDGRIALSLSPRDVQRLRSALANLTNRTDEDRSLDRNLGNALIAYRREHPPNVEHVVLANSQDACDRVESRNERFVPVHRWRRPVAVGDRCFCRDRVADPVLVQILNRE